jgi:hypothetical protein
MPKSVNLSHFSAFKNATALTFWVDTLFALPREKAMTARWPALTQKKKIYLGREKYIYKTT